MALERALNTFLADYLTPFLNVTSGALRIRIEHGHVYDPFYAANPRVYEMLGAAAAPLLRIYPDIYKAWSGTARVRQRAAKWLRETSDEYDTPEQEAAIRELYSGKLGGPVGEYVKLYGNVVATERVPITFEVVKGKGRLLIGADAEAELAPYTSGSGRTTTLNDSVFSTIDGAPAYVGKASKFRLAIPSLDINLNIEGYNAIQGRFLFEN